MERRDFAKSGFVKLPPGFRFQPTDEELVVQYLRRKAFSFPLPAAIIPEIELGKLNPSSLSSGFGGERYFFYLRDGKYGKKKKKGGVSNHEKILGYWKSMGKEKPVIAASMGNELVGTKQAMVFHSGNPPHGSKTDWIMHEYRLYNKQLLMSSAKDMVESGKEWVVCRIFAKRRSMNLKTRNRKKLEEKNQASVTSSSSSSSCVTDDALDEDPVLNGEDEAMSKNTIA